MRMMWLLMLCGCWLSDAEITERYEGAVDPDSDVDPSAVTTEIVSVEPGFGTDAGGTEVVLTVDAASSDPVVRVGGAEATVVSTTPTTIVIQTPAGTPGEAAIVVASPDGDVPSDTDFWYWEDGEGQFGTVGWISYSEYTGDLAMLGYVDDAEAVFQFVEPTSEGTAAIWGTELDTCGTQSTDLDHRAIDWGAQDIQLRTPESSPLSLGYDAELEQYERTMELEEWEPDASFDLLLPQGTAPFPYFDYPNIVATPPPFIVIAPDFEQERLFSERLGADVVRDFELVWGGGSTGDYITVTVVRWGLDGTGLQWEVKERVRCLLNDDGRYTFAANTWAGWDPGSPIDIYVGRSRVVGGILPHNRATNDVAGRYVVGGTAWQSLFR